MDLGRIGHTLVYHQYDWLDVVNMPFSVIFPSHFRLKLTLYMRAQLIRAVAKGFKCWRILFGLCVL